MKMSKKPLRSQASHIVFNVYQRILDQQDAEHTLSSILSHVQALTEYYPIDVVMPRLMDRIGVPYADPVPNPKLRGRLNFCPERFRLKKTIWKREE